jgi:MFS family permease
MCGISVISALVLPLLQFVINALGWRWGYGLLGLLIIGCGLPVVLVALQNENGTITRRDGAEPVEARREPGPNLRQALARIDFWLLALAFILSAIPLGGYIGNLQPLLTDAGASPAIAALIGSIFALSMLGGQLVSGPLLDRFHPHIVAAAFLFLPGLAALMLSRVGDGLAPGPAVVIAIVIIGVAQGALVNFIGFFVARHFGVKHYALIFGVLIAGVGLGMSAGGLGFAWSFDRHGNYSLASLCSALGFVLAGVFMLRSARQKSVAATMVADLRS